VVTLTLLAETSVWAEGLQCVESKLSLWLGQLPFMAALLIDFTSDGPRRFIVLRAARVLASPQKTSRVISSFRKLFSHIQKCEGHQKNFSSSDLYITNYARELVPLAYFLAILFARKGKILSTKTC
jgi:hypothetical protein